MCCVRLVTCLSEGREYIPVNSRSVALDITDRYYIAPISHPFLLSSEVYILRSLWEVWRRKSLDHISWSGIQISQLLLFIVWTLSPFYLSIFSVYVSIHNNRLHCLHCKTKSAKPIMQSSFSSVWEKSGTTYSSVNSAQLCTSFLSTAHLLSFMWTRGVLSCKSNTPAAFRKARYLFILFSVVLVCLWDSPVACSNKCCLTWTCLHWCFQIYFLLYQLTAVSLVFLCWTVF